MRYVHHPPLHYQKGVHESPFHHPQQRIWTSDDQLTSAITWFHGRREQACLGRLHLDPRRTTALVPLSRNDLVIVAPEFEASIRPCIEMILDGDF